MTVRNRKPALADSLDGIALSASQMAVARARMQQAEEIAETLAAIGAGVGAVARWAQHAVMSVVRHTKPAA